MVCRINPLLTSRPPQGAAPAQLPGERGVRSIFSSSLPAKNAKLSSVKADAKSAARDLYSDWYLARACYRYDLGQEE